MSKTVVILQPSYLPWLGFFDQLYQSDVFVVYDDVQYDKNGWRNRNRIKTERGAQWLTVPVYIKNKPKINEVMIDNKNDWPQKHLQAIKTNYGKSPYFKKYYDGFSQILLKKHERLLDLNLELIEFFAKELGIEREICLSSKLNVGGEKISRLINICKHLGADRFFEGAAGKNYIQKEEFDKSGVRIDFQDYQHPVYRQLFGDFAPYLSIIDLLFNEGENSLKIILSSNKNS